MKTSHFLLLFILFFSCKNNSNKSHLTYAEIQEKSAQFDTLFSELHDEGKFNGTVLIADGGEVIFDKAFGMADYSKNITLTPQSKFELASVSKQFTAMGIVQLQKQGLLSYDDDFTKYIPEMKAYKGITIKNLLNHTGGLADYMDLAENEFDETTIATNDDIILLFQKKNPPADFKPNQTYEYSNTGYLLLATIIERVSGKSFGDFLSEAIFKPAGMKNTFIYRRRYAPRQIENYANGYLYSDSLDQLVIPDNLESESYVVYLDGIVGDGMVNSNTHDLLLWDRILYTEKLINQEDKDAIFQSYTTLDSSSTDYGFGWGIDYVTDYGKVASHAGGWAGYVTYIERHLDNDKTIIMLQNQLTNDTEIPLKNARRILYDLPVEKPIELDSSILKKYVGFYMSDSGKDSEIKFENSKLIYPYPPHAPKYDLELIPVSETKFILDGFNPEVTYTFKLNEKGEVKSCRVQQIDQNVNRILIKQD